jgi:hypothetical protein
MVVESGKEFMLDEVFNNSKWNSGVGICAVALGVSTDNIGGPTGPSAGSSVAIGGAWNGVLATDWRLSSEVTRHAIISLTREANQMKAVAQFSDSDFAAIFVANVAKIREAGLFLNVTTPPVADPTASPAQKPYAMIARRVYFGYDSLTNPQYYVDQPFYVFNDGNPVMFEYRITLG